VDHLGIREIAEVLKKGESTVKTHLYRALKKFRQNPGLHALLKGGVL
jgi:DNA-directed RNA polymerase specialized sigma24 family protein